MCCFLCFFGRAWSPPRSFGQRRSVRRPKCLATPPPVPLLPSTTHYIEEEQTLAERSICFLHQYYYDITRSVLSNSNTHGWHNSCVQTLGTPLSHIIKRWIFVPPAPAASSPPSTASGGQTGGGNRMRCYPPQVFMPVVVKIYARKIYYAQPG